MLNPKIKSSFLALLCALTLTLTACSGCGGNEDDSQSSDTADTSSPTSEETTPSESESETSSLDADDNYYQSVIAALEEKLLLEKQDKYISNYEYELKLKELQLQIDALKNQSGGNVVTDKPVVDTNAPTENLGATETGTSPESTPTFEGEKMSFRYGIVDGTITIYEYLGGTTTVAIPSTINGYRVTAIADYAFANSDVTTVVIPPSVKSIGWFAFNGCSSLSSVSIPASVSSIGYAAFDGCNNVTILCTAKSYAKEYAASFGMSYQVI